MLTEQELDQLCQKLGLSKEARKVIDHIRISPPSRRVRSAVGNVSVQFKSRKMGRTIQAESHKVELAGIYEKEFDENTLEFWDQPPKIKLLYKRKDGRNTGVWSTPDYFVIRTDGVGWEEWKTEEELGKWAETKSDRFIREENVWRCPSGEEHASKFGFFFRVRSSAEINWVLQRNFRFLEDYRRVKQENLDKEVVSHVKSFVGENPGVLLVELLTTEKSSPDVIYAMITHELIHVDLQTAALADPECVHVFRDRDTALGYATAIASSQNRPIPFVTIGIGTSVNWDGQVWKIVDIGDTENTLLSADGMLNHLPRQAFDELVKTGHISNPNDQGLSSLHPASQELLDRASPSDHEIALERLAIIKPYLDGNPPENESIPARTIRNYIRKHKQAEETFGCGYVGLLNQYHASGNRRPKLPSNVKELMTNFILNDYETHKQKGMFAVYGDLVKRCEEQGMDPPSYKTFTKEIHARSEFEQTEKRQGKRASYQKQSFYYELELTTPRHGDRPFEIGHIDHTELDIELICSSTQQNLGKPWMTILTDAYSRRLLAVTISFDPPSYRACMAVFRECVMRYSRLPQTIVVDGGREFGSVYFETLLACYEIHKKLRPGARPRFGSVCERLFGTANTQFIHNLLGNTQITKNVRQVTKSVNPKNQAVWTLPELYSRLCEWAYEVYDTIEHPALSQAPRDAFITGMQKTGNRLHKLIPYDESFRMLTLPTTRKGTAKVHPQLGVKINYIYYWSNAFRDPDVSKIEVPVRYDPFNAGIAYAFVKRQWVQCISQHYAIFAGRSEREIQVATAVLRKQYQLHSQQFAVTAHKLAVFLSSVEAEENQLLLNQQLHDAEYRQILSLKEKPILEQTAGLAKSEESSGAEATNLPGQQAEATETLEIYGDY